MVLSSRSKFFAKSFKGSSSGFGFLSSQKKDSFKLSFLCDFVLGIFVLDC